MYAKIRINKLIQHERRVELKDDLRVSKSRDIENITSFHIRYILACNRCHTDINSRFIFLQKRGKVYKMFVFMTMISLIHIVFLWAISHEGNV